MMTALMKNRYWTVIMLTIIFHNIPLPLVFPFDNLSVFKWKLKKGTSLAIIWHGYRYDFWGYPLYVISTNWPPNLANILSPIHFGRLIGPSNFARSIYDFLAKNFFRQIFPTLRNDRSRSRPIDRWSLPLRQTSFPTPHLRRYGPWLARRSWYLAQRRKELPRKYFIWRHHNVIIWEHNVVTLYTAAKCLHVHWSGI